VATLVAVIWRRDAHAERGLPPTERDHLELGTLAIVAAFALVQTAGAAPLDESPLYPVIYLVMAFVVAFMPRRPSFILVGIALALDLAIFIRHGSAVRHLTTAIAHASFIGLFAGLYHTVLSAQVTSGRRAE